MGNFKETEQIGCHYYNIPSPCKFRSFELKPGTKFTETRNEFTRIIFLLTGEITIDCDACYNHTLKQQEIVLLPIGCRIAINAEQESSLIVCSFLKMPQVCNRGPTL
ncbi:MAG: hypothetical protein LUH63_11550 [Parabacteroides sp.]|nr:hypothetical protein [Parabacteroides sp.]